MAKEHKTTSLVNRLYLGVIAGWRWRAFPLRFIAIVFLTHSFSFAAFELAFLPGTLTVALAFVIFGTRAPALL